MLSKNNLVLYEIYPRSFQDSNGDGYGDLQGILSRIDYLSELGITAVWLPPIFPSPMKDNGYDITDYYSIHPQFGTLADFEELVRAVHQRKMLFVLDLVVNHTSDKHPWFLASRSNKANPKRDWYIWKDPVNGEKPNNWKSVFDPSVWELDELTGQYYYHSYLKEQPDLNWKNPAVLQAVKDICAFWLDKGVDGLRLDGVNYYWKDQRFLDEPNNPTFDPLLQAPFYELDHIYMKDQDEHYALVDELAKFVFTHSKSFLIPQAHPARSGLAAIPRYKKYYEIGVEHNVLPFNFELIELPWDAHKVSTFISSFLTSLTSEDLPLFVLGSHDRKRVAARIGQERARVAALMLLTLPGMPVIYYGEELGMEDVRPIPPEKITDTKELRSPGFGRDPDRTPMQWDKTIYAGFSTVEPWLPLESVFRERNVASEEKDPISLLSLYKKLLSLRNNPDQVLIHGSFTLSTYNSNDVVSYYRTLHEKTYLICLNFTPTLQKLDLKTKKYRMILSSTMQSDQTDCTGIITLQPNEGVLLECVKN